MKVVACYLGVVGFLRELGVLNIFIPHLALLEQAIVSFEEYAQITAVFLKSDKYHFSYLPLPIPYTKGQNLYNMCLPG